MKFYHVECFIYPQKCPALSCLYKTKQSASNSFKKRFESGCYDEVMLWLEDSDKAHFIGGVGEVLKVLKKGD